MENISGEIWKDIEGFENMYQISNYGRIKSLSRKMINSGTYTGFFFSKERLLKPRISKQGYYCVGITKNKKNSSYQVHRLVALHFIENPLNKPEVNHKDGNKLNNHIANLEWNTKLENMQHAFELGLYKSRPEHQLNITKKAKEVNMKPVLQFSKQGIFIAEYSCAKEAAIQNSLKQHNISNCCNNKPHNKTCEGYIWKFK